MKNRAVFFCLSLIIGVLWTNRVWGDTFCSPAPLPSKEERTDDFWKTYVKESLISCYGDLHPEIRGAGVSIHDGWMSMSWCPITGCIISVGRQFLNSTDNPWDVLFVLGHEAGHIAVDGVDFRLLRFEELEYAADLIAIQPIPRGACHGAAVLSWHLPRLTEATDILEVEKQAAILMMQQRIVVLRAHCIVDIAFEYVQRKKELTK